MEKAEKLPSGKWRIKFRKVGFDGRTQSFATEREANAWLVKQHHAANAGSYVDAREAERTSFAEVAERYSREVLANKRGQVPDDSRLRRLVEVFGKRSLASITSSVLSKFRDDLGKTLSPQSVVHHIGLVSRIFKACSLDWGIALPNGNPATLVRKPKVSNERSRRLESIEETILLAALSQCKSPWPRAAFILAIETAGRQSELLSLKWKEVDLIKRTARLRGVGGRMTKSGAEYRDVPLSSRAVELLASLPRSVVGRVFPISQNALQLSFERALARGRRDHLHCLLRAGLRDVGFTKPEVAAQIRALIYGKKEPLELSVKLLAELEASDQTLEDFHFHDSRHEAISRMADKLAMHEMMKVAGHSTAKMMARYYHPRAEDLALKLG